MESQKKRRTEGRTKSSSRKVVAPVLPLKINKTQKQMIAISGNLKKLFIKTCPRCTSRDISYFTADMSGLWEVSKVHERLIHSLLHCSYPKDKEKIENLLMEITVNWLSQAADHLSTLRKILPRLRRSVGEPPRKGKKTGGLIG